jgi:hypothetical protein
MLGRRLRPPGPRDALVVVRHLARKFRHGHNRIVKDILDLTGGVVDTVEDAPWRRSGPHQSVNRSRRIRRPEFVGDGGQRRPKVGREGLSPLPVNKAASPLQPSQPVRWIATAINAELTGNIALGRNCYSHALAIVVVGLAATIGCLLAAVVQIGS